MFISNYRNDLPSVREDATTLPHYSALLMTTRAERWGQSMRSPGRELVLPSTSPQTGHGRSQIPTANESLKMIVQGQLPLAVSLTA